MNDRFVSDEKLTKEEYDKTMLNGYFYLVHDESVEQAFMRNCDEKIYYPFNTEALQKHDIVPMLKHFESEKYQEFEKCIELKKIYDNWNYRQSN